MHLLKLFLRPQHLWKGFSVYQEIFQRSLSDSLFQNLMFMRRSYYHVNIYTDCLSNYNCTITIRHLKLEFNFHS